MADTLATWGGWAPAIRDDPFGHFAEARARCPVQKVRLADGHPAWVVLGYDAARQALGDPRISKDMLAALEADGNVVAGGLPGPEFSRHMLNVDPPDHTRLRRLVSRAFTPGRVAALEPAIRAIASDLLQVLEAAGPRRHRRPHRGICPSAAIPGDRRAARHPCSRQPAPPRLVRCAAERMGR
jgi:cytochrome P450